jgi:DNA-directed RNA polymerase specialized sigma24 family protein
MDLDGSVTRYLDQCKAGNPEAAGPLWDRYFPHLAARAEQELRGRLGGACDGEDVAVSVFASFFQALARKRYQRLGGRDELWALLQTILGHKVLDRLKHARRGRRDVRRVQGGLRVDDLEGREPTPDEAARLAEDCRRLLDRLGDGRLREVALLKVEGHTDAEIAAKLDCGLRTVQRKLERIRYLWSKEAGHGRA